eukprot:TRINITY_DN4029_c0_g1_i1.p1 TRINITY_DN4029_c0_g1~~TRINITY_DN4029_c0_g1_i1.p1  ORF type:complete len:213 (+),score=29.73 TRINITY_DN4029_c0_g1_i1:60-698(+)
MSRGSLIYAIVFTNNSIFGETTSCKSEEVKLTSKKIIQNIDCQNNQLKAFSSKGFVYNVVVWGSVCYIAVATENFSRNLSFSFLESIRDEYNYKYKVQPSLRAEFISFLEGEMRFFSENPEADKIRGLQEKVDEVKAVMLENIDKVLQRGEKLEDIDRKAEELNKNTEVFVKKSKRLKCDLFKKNIYLTLLIGVCLLVILAIVGVVLYIHFK